MNAWSEQLGKVIQILLKKIRQKHWKLQRRHLQPNQIKMRIRLRLYSLERSKVKHHDISRVESHRNL